MSEAILQDLAGLTGGSVSTTNLLLHKLIKEVRELRKDINDKNSAKVVGSVPVLRPVVGEQELLCRVRLGDWGSGRKDGAKEFRHSDGVLEETARTPPPSAR